MYVQPVVGFNDHNMSKKTTLLDLDLDINTTFNPIKILHHFKASKDAIVHRKRNPSFSKRFDYSRR